MAPLPVADYLLVNSSNVVDKRFILREYKFEFKFSFKHLLCKNCFFFVGRLRLNIDIRIHEWNLLLFDTRYTTNYTN